MPFFAHAVIETEEHRYERGSEVPEDLAGFDELVEAGSVSEEQYDASVEAVPAPDVIEMDGVRYVRASDGEQEFSNASF